jgi:hypothetical protein
MIARQLQETNFANNMLREKGSETSKFIFKIRNFGEFRRTSENHSTVRELSFIDKVASGDTVLSRVPGTRLDLQAPVSVPTYTSKFPSTAKKLRPQETHAVCTRKKKKSLKS